MSERSSDKEKSELSAFPKKFGSLYPKGTNSGADKMSERSSDKEKSELSSSRHSKPVVA